MGTITNNEMGFILRLLKSKREYNANSIAKELKISAMGALKIAKKLEKENIISSKQMGKAKFYKLNFNEYTKQYLRFLLKREAEQSQSYIKRWINELKKIKNADIIILFGSILKKLKSAKDIDVLLVTDKRRIKNLKKEINDINMINIKKIHPIYQNFNDLRKNLKEDEIILNAVEGIIVIGEEKFVKLFEK